MQSVGTKNHELYSEYERNIGENLRQVGIAEYGENVTVVPSKENIWTQNPAESWGPIEYTVTIISDKLLQNNGSFTPLSLFGEAPIILGNITKNSNFARFSVIFPEKPKLWPSPFKIERISESNNTTHIGINSPASYPMVSTPSLNSSTTFFDNSLNSPLPNLMIPKDPEELKRDEKERLAQYKEEDLKHLLDDSVVSSPVTNNPPPPPENPASPPSGWAWSVISSVRVAFNWLWNHIFGALFRR